ncbi:MAG: type 4a pilus biogenesis protein PilO [Candidatus Paceibacterota bacterium]
MRSGLTPIIIIIICIATYYLYLSPSYADLKMVMEDRDKFADVLEKAKNISTKRDEVLSEYKSIPVDDIEKMKKVVPVNFDGPSLANDINSLASRYNTSIDSFDYALTSENNSEVALEEQKPTPYQKIKVSFTMDATYPQFVSFLKDLEKNLQLIDVYSIKVVPNSQNEDSSILGFSVEANTYSLR